MGHNTVSDGTFFPFVLLCQVFVLAGISFCFKYYLCTWSTIQMWCCVCFFGCGGKMVFDVTDLLSVHYSCAVVSVFCCGGKANLVRLTLFYSTLLALTDRQTEKWIHSLHVGWRNLFSSCAAVLCQFLVLEGNAGTRSTLFSGRLFWYRAGNSCWCYVST